MRPNDGATDREAKTSANHGVFLAAALKLVEHPIALPGGQTRPLVLDDDTHEIFERFRPHLRTRPGRRVLGDIVEQIEEDLYDEIAVNMPRRGVGGNRQIDRMC
jgi:hypothetical protein